MFKVTLAGKQRVSYLENLAINNHDENRLIVARLTGNYDVINLAVELNEMVRKESGDYFKQQYLRASIDEKIKVSVNDNPLKGISVGVLRNTRGVGETFLSDEFNKFLLVSDNKNLQIIDDSSFHMKQILFLKEIDGYYYTKPLIYEYNNKHTMMNGNFIYSSDGRYFETFKYPIAIHDRIEN